MPTSLARDRTSEDAHLPDVLQFMQLMWADLSRHFARQRNLKSCPVWERLCSMRRVAGSSKYAILV
jgi:hypothetical protein